MQPDYVTSFPFPLPDFFSNALALVEQGYLMADTLVSRKKFLLTACGSDLIPYLRNVAVEFCFLNKYQHSGKMHCLEAKNKGRNCHHIEIFSDDTIITISQTHNVRDLPRKSVFRNDLSNNPQLLLRDAFSEDAFRAEKRTYYILTHGGANSIFEKPDFIALGIPHSSEKKWIFQYLLKSKGLSTVPLNVNPLPEEQVAEENLITEFRDFLKDVGEGG
jgi:hypothetical protein